MEGPVIPIRRTFVGGKEVPKEVLRNELLSMKFKKTKQGCRKNPDLCKGDFWKIKAVDNYGTEPENYYPYPYKDNYYNYLAARVRGINRQIKGLLKYPNVKPEDFGLSLEQIRALPYEKLKNIAAAIDSEIDRKAFEPLDLSEEETHVALYRRLNTYFDTVDRNLQEIPKLERKAEKTSIKIAEHLRNTYPNRFNYKEIEREELFPPGNRINSPGFRLDREDFVVVRTPYDEVESVFATLTLEPPRVEVMVYSSGRVDRLPDLFEEFLVRMGLTYRAAGELYGYNFRAIGRNYNWF